MTYNCIMCGSEHTELFGNDPHRYCAPCNKRKQELKGVASEIIPYNKYFEGGIWLGDAQSAKIFKGVIICVHENAEYCVKGAIHLPILEKLPNSVLDRTGAVASLRKLNNVSARITSYTIDKNKILIHCAGGVERSPLALAYHLASIGFKENIEEAYKYIIERRSIVSRRLYWLPE